MQYVTPVFVSSKWLCKFWFFYSADLPDPKKLLVGESKRMSHVKIKTGEEADNPAFRKLIAAVWKKCCKEYCRNS